MKKQEIDSKEDKNRRIAIELELLEKGTVIAPTNLAKKIDIHVHRLRDALDQFESLNEIGFQILRDKNKNIRGILRMDENLNLRRDVRDIKKDILDIKNTLDEIKSNYEK